MSYKALYRTYRPQKFNEVVGQNHIVSTLENVIKQKKIGHAYLFAGPRGTGKTSIAHIFARAINKNSAGIEEFDEMDIIEIDAASNNGVVEVRNIISNVNYAPAKANYKVYIIDEVHMLTKGAFNALLKTLEEPPTHVIFILATTEPHKIPITILSRTQRFNFRRIDDESIKKQLTSVLEQEKIKYDDEAIKFITKLSQGGMRDALSIADQSSAFGNGEISFEIISQVFGIISIENQIDIFNKAYNGKSKELMHLVIEFLNNGIDIERLAISLLDIVKDFIIYKKTNDESLMLFITKDEVETLDIDINYAYEVIDILMHLNSELRYSVVPRQSFELAILKISNNSKRIENKDTKENKIVQKEDEDKFFEEIIKVQKDIPIDNEIQKVEKKEFENELEKTFKIAVEDKNINMGEDINSDLMEITQEISVNEEEIENDLLSTQEIDLIADNVEHTSSNFVITDKKEKEKIIDTNENHDIDDENENNILRIFEDSDNESKDLKNEKSEIDNVLNLFVQTDKDKFKNIKESWNKLINYYETNKNNVDDKYKIFVDLLIKTKLICAGKNFILVASEEDEIVEGLKIKQQNDKLFHFVEEIFGEKNIIFAITKETFYESKKEYAKLNEKNELPIPTKIELPKVKEIKKTNEEKIGEDLFGELFSS